MSESLSELEALMRELGKVISRLDAMDKRLETGKIRKFTPDGQLVGSIGEVVAATENGLELVHASTPGYDAIRKAEDDQEVTVEIKSTQGRSVAFRIDETDRAAVHPDEVIVLRLDFLNGGWKTIYNGPFQPIQKVLLTRKPQKNGQRSIALSKLAELQREVEALKG